MTYSVRTTEKLPGVPFFLTATHEKVTRSAPAHNPNDAQHLTLTPEN